MFSKPDFVCDEFTKRVEFYAVSSPLAIRPREWVFSKESGSPVRVPSSGIGKVELSNLDKIYVTTDSKIPVAKFDPEDILKVISASSVLVDVEMEIRTDSSKSYEEDLIIRNNLVLFEIDKDEDFTLVDYAVLKNNGYASVVF